jgi:uncharacterized membrane protein
MGQNPGKCPGGNGKTYWNDVKIIKLLVISHHFSPSEQALHFKASGKIQWWSITIFPIISAG